MSITRREAHRNARWSWALGLLLALAGLGLLWSCAEKLPAGTAPTALQPEVIKTTIRITKGRIDQQSIWSASLGEGENQAGSITFEPNKPIPADWWQRMNGTVESFTEYDCDGTATELVQPLYTVINEKGDPEGVKVVGDVGQKPDWGPVYCNAEGCFLPAYYFNNVMKDSRTCVPGPQERYWKMILKN
jgi:hypothetical protein